MAKLCSDLILGQDFQQKHKSIVTKHGGDLPALKVGNGQHQKRQSRIAPQ